MLVILLLGRQRQEELWGLLTRHPSQINGPHRQSEALSSQKARWLAPEVGHSRWTYGENAVHTAHIHTHTTPHHTIHTYTIPCTCHPPHILYTYNTHITYTHNIHHSTIHNTPHIYYTYTAHTHYNTTQNTHTTHPIHIPHRHAHIHMYTNTHITHHNILHTHPTV